MGGNAVRVEEAVQTYIHIESRNRVGPETFGNSTKTQTFHKYIRFDILNHSVFILVT